MTARAVACSMAQFPYKSKSDARLASVFLKVPVIIEQGLELDSIVGAKCISKLAVFS